MFKRFFPVYKYTYICNYICIIYI